MSLKRLQLLFFLGICGVTLTFCVKFILEAYQYFSLKSAAPAQILQWETVPIKDRYAIRASYQFKAAGKIHRSAYTLSAPYYLNEFAAFEALKDKAKHSWTAWYNPAHPQSSALQRSFPLGLFIKFIICLSVTIYFFCFYKRSVAV